MIYDRNARVSNSTYTFYLVIRKSIYIVACMLLGAPGCQEHNRLSSEDLVESIWKAGKITPGSYTNASIGVALRYSKDLSVYYGPGFAEYEWYPNVYGRYGELFAVGDTLRGVLVRVTIPPSFVDASGLTAEDYVMWSDSVSAALFRELGYKVTKRVDGAMCHDVGIVDYFMEQNGTVTKLRIRAYIMQFDRLLLAVHILCQESDFQELVNPIHESLCSVPSTIATIR